MVALSKLVISALTALVVVNFSALPYSLKTRRLCRQTKYKNTLTVLHRL